jgi:hypothetical protein
VNCTESTIYTWQFQKGCNGGATLSGQKSTGICTVEGGMRVKHFCGYTANGFQVGFSILSLFVSILFILIQ